MSNKAGAATKDTEEKLESTYGDHIGATGYQVNGKAKQDQASAMSAAKDLKGSVSSAAKVPVMLAKDRK